MKTKLIYATTLSLFIAFTACKKDDEPTIKESEAVIKTNIQIESPEALGRTATWPEIFFNLDNQTASATKSGQIIFTGGYNVDLGIVDTVNYKFGVFTDASKTLETITYEYLKTADINYSTTSFGLQMTNPIGWYGYNLTTHSLSTIDGKFAIVYKGTSLENAEKIYIIKANAIGYIIVDNVNKLYKGQTNFDFKTYTKQ